LNESGLAEVVIELDAYENEISKCEKEYLENGLISHEKSHLNGQPSKEEKFEYDDKGNLTKKIFRNYADNVELIDLYHYDDHHNMIYNCSHQNGVLVFENKCGYDENNHLVLEEFFELDFWERKIVRHERLKHELKEQIPPNNPTYQ
jgi:antitoxin component YwqK of YwqJK toxin-antitoxin module